MAGYGQQSMPRTPRSARMSSPGRPASNASIRSVASARSAQSYRKLEAQQAKDRLKNLIMIKAQMDATGRGKKFGNNNRSRLANLAEKEATRLVASGAVAGILPARFKPGFFENCTDRKLLAAIDEAAATCTAAAAVKPTPMAPTPPPPVESSPVPSSRGRAHAAGEGCARRHLPSINVAGKPTELEQLVRDKIMQRGHGGAHQLRKAFKVFDQDGSGLISLPEFNRFLESINLKINIDTLRNFFELWAAEAGRDIGVEGMHDYEQSDATVLNYNEFIAKILPADYPKRTKMYADDLASLAFEDRKRPFDNKSINTVRDFETQFREAIQQRSQGGGSEMAKQFKMFDNTGKGFVTFDDLMAAARSWNLDPTQQVCDLVRKSWLKAENLDSGVIEYYDFVNKILPSDFNNAADVMRVFKQKMEDNWAHVADGFMKMDKDRSGKVDRQEIMLALDQLNIYVPAKVAKTFLDQIDKDGDGEVDFQEFANAIKGMDPDAHKEGLGQIWDGDNNVKKRIMDHRPTTAASLHSEGDAEDDIDVHVDEYYAKQGATKPVDVVDGHFSIDGIPINMIEIIRDKIYRKRGGVNQLRRAFMELDRDGSGTINRIEFRDFLAPYNLNLSPQALALCVDLFDPDGSRQIDFNEFCRKVMPDDYSYLTDKHTGARKMQGVPAIVINRGRRVVQPLQPKMVGPFDSKSTVPTPGEPRAVQHIREKVDQRTRNSNDKKPELQLRDALLLHDHAKDGKISQGAFRQVLERYNVFLSQAEFSQIVEVYGSQGDDGTDGALGGTIEYKPFLAKVVTRQSSGAFGPHVAAKWQMRPGGGGSPARSGRIQSPRSSGVRAAAASEVFQNYYTPRAVRDVRRNERVAPKIGAHELYQNTGAAMTGGWAR